MKKKTIKIRDDETDKIIHEIDVSGKSQHQIEKVVNGLLQKVDQTRFTVIDP